MECKNNISLEDKFYNDLYNLVTPDVREHFSVYKEYIDEEIDKYCSNLLNQIKKVTRITTTIKFHEHICSTDKINKCLTNRIYDLYKISVTFNQTNFKTNFSKEVFLMGNIFPKYEMCNYQTTVRWKSTNPHIYSIIPRLPNNQHIYNAPVKSACSNEMEFSDKKFSFHPQPENLGNILWKNAQLGSDTDVSFIVKDKLFMAHLCILNARSQLPIFKAMFDTAHFDEGKTRCANIYDFQPEIFEIFLKFLYTENIDAELGLEEVTELYSLADQYTVENLKNWALSIIEENINNVNDPAIFKSLLDFALKYKEKDESILMLLFNHLDNQESESLLTDIKNNSLLKSFITIASDKNLNRAAKHFKAQIINNI